MSRLHYLDEREVRSIIETLTHDLFPETPAFQLAGDEGAGRLDSALAQPQWRHYRTAQQKAAALHFSINKNHPYVDGNKRLAVAAMEWFLFRNSFALMATSEELLDFSLRVADDRLTREESARWVHARALRTTWTEERIHTWFEALTTERLDELVAARTEFLAAVAGLVERGIIK